MELTGALWRKSSYSNNGGGSCVEVAQNLPGIVAVRDSKDPDSAHLIFTPAEWQTFTTAIHSGHYDHL
jgi:hypothetical protein